MAFVGCSTTPNSNHYLGSWHADNGGGTTKLEIKENDEAIIKLLDESGNEQPDETVKMKWSIDEKGQLVLNQESNNQEQIVSFRNGNLFATEGGRTLKFAKNDKYNNAP